VGLAWTGTMCSADRSCGIDEARFGSLPELSANTIAHELAHNLNSPHDGSGNSCPSTGFIMASSSCANCGEIPDEFSSCSISRVDSFVQNAPCLDNPATIPYPDEDPCGNYILDDGEDCDVGPSGSSCCYGKESTNPCTWRPGAVCDDSQSLCCSNCQLQPTTFTCRESTDPCDPEDKCMANVSP